MRESYFFFSMRVESSRHALLSPMRIILHFTSYILYFTRTLYDYMIEAKHCRIIN